MNSTVAAATKPSNTNNKIKHSTGENVGTFVIYLVVALFALISPAAGFIFDSSNVQSELTNLQTEIISSIYPIKVGMVSYEDNIDAAIEKLKAAGLDKYMEEYRTQFKAYLDANPDVLEIAKGTTEG